MGRAGVPAMAFTLPVSIVSWILLKETRQNMYLPFCFLRVLRFASKTGIYMFCNDAHTGGIHKRAGCSRQSKINELWAEANFRPFFRCLCLRPLSRDESGGLLQVLLGRWRQEERVSKELVLKSLGQCDSAFSYTIVDPSVRVSSTQSVSSIQENVISLQ